MRVYIQLFIICLLFGAGSCLKPNSGMTIYKNEGFIVDIPTDLKVRKECPVEDFELHSFVIDTTTILTVYVGNQPSFPSCDVKGVSEMQGEINGYAVRCVSSESQGKYTREVLFDFSKIHDWPQYLHFSYAYLPLDDARIADQIIDSVRTAK